MVEMWNFLFVLSTGKESIMCIKRLSEVAGIGKRSPCKEAGNCYTPVHAGTGDGAGKSSCPKDPSGSRRKTCRPEAISPQEINT